VTVRADPRLGFLLVLLIATVFVTGNVIVVFGAWRTYAATATPVIGLTMGWAGTLLVRAVRERREKRQLRKQFGTRISRQLFDFLLENPDQVHFQGEEREVTCFFSDLAGFTAISERLDSKQTVGLLNKYMFAMNEELTKLNAYVNKFLGDGVMAVWGAFATDTHNAERACRAALACMERLDQLNAQTEFEDLPKLSMRIGIATGLVTVGDCGAPPELSDYTVIGDSANLAARLESANKQFETRILVNERTHELLPRELLTRPLGRITVVGQKTPTRVFEVIAVAGRETEAQRDLIARTARAVTLFESGEFEAARRAWAELAEAHGATKLSDLYTSECARLLATPDPDFDGVLRLTEK
jgi:adenylate cyclase